MIQTKTMALLRFKKQQLDMRARTILERWNNGVDVR